MSVNVNNSENTVNVNPTFNTVTVIPDPNSTIIQVSTPGPQGPPGDPSNLTGSFVSTGSFNNFTSSYYTDSSSFDTRINEINTADNAYATTGSNIFKGDQTITGSLFVSSQSIFDNGVSIKGTNSLLYPNVGYLDLQGASGSRVDLYQRDGIATLAASTNNIILTSLTGSFNAIFPNGNLFLAASRSVHIFSSTITASADVAVSGGLLIGTTNFTPLSNEKLIIDGGDSISYNLITAKSNTDNYSQFNIININSGSNASSDVVATNDIGTETTYYVDLGINSSQFAGEIGGPNDAYLYTTGSNLLIANITPDKNILINTSGSGATIISSSVQVTGSLTISGSNTFTNIGPAIFSGSVNISGSAYLNSEEIITSAFTSSLIVSSSETSSYVPGAIATASANLTTITFTKFDGSTFDVMVEQSGSVESASYADFAVTASYALNVPETASFAVSASQAVTANSSSYPIAILGTNIYTPLSGNYINLTPTDESTIYGYEAGANKLYYSNDTLIGNGAGADANPDSVYLTLLGYLTGYKTSGSDGLTALGYNAGVNSERARYSTFVGFDAGQNSHYLEYSTALGNGAGSYASHSFNTTFLGEGAGVLSKHSQYSNFIGNGAGTFSISASYSNFIGFNAGSSGNFYTLGRNNILIGTGVTLPPNTKDSINIGGLIFGTGSYFNEVNVNIVSSGSANGKIGINQPLPQYSLDVSGSGNYTDKLTVSGGVDFGNGSKIILDEGLSGSIDIKAGPGGWAELQSNDANQYIWVDDNGAYIGTNWNVDTHQWTFDKSGSINLPINSTASILNQDGSPYTASSAISASYATTSSYADNFDVNGTLTATTLIVQTITSSIDYVTGSTIFGSELTNTHQFTGSVTVTGSLAVNDSIVILTNQTSSMAVATASYADFAVTAAYASNVPETASYAISASQAITASYADNANIDTGSFATTGSNVFIGEQIITGSLTATAQVITSNVISNGSGLNIFSSEYVDIYGPNAGGELFLNSSGAYILTDNQNAQVKTWFFNKTGSLTLPISGSQAILNPDSTPWTASYALSASNAANAYNATSSSYALNSTNAISASQATNANNAISASYALTASYASNVPETASFAISASQAQNANNATSASYSQNTDNAISASYAISASQATNADNAQTASFSLQANNSYTASYVETAQTASYVLNAISASYAENSLTASFAINSTNAETASYVELAQTASYVETAQTASYVLQAISASFANEAVSASYAATASYADNFTVANVLTAQTLNVQTVSSSVIYSSGSNIFGNDLSNTQEFTGSVSVTGSLAINNSLVILTEQTSSMSVLSASYTTTASYAIESLSGSYAVTASFIDGGSY